MAKFDTDAVVDVTTRSEAYGPDVVSPREIATEAHNAAGSIPSGVPEVVEAEGYAYVFRIGGSPQAGSVTITLDTEQLVEQEKVRKINRAIQRARRG